MLSQIHSFRTPALVYFQGHLSNPKHGHTIGGPRRGGTRRGAGAGRGRTGRRLIGSSRKQPFFFLVSQSIERSKHKRNPMQTDGGTKHPVDDRLITGLSAGRRPLFVPGCCAVGRRLFVPVNLFHARHIREFLDSKKSRGLTGCLEIHSGTPAVQPRQHRGVQVVAPDPLIN